MLSQTLRHLASARIVHREVLSTCPPRVLYSLTHEGCELFHLLATLSEKAHGFGLLGATGAA